MKLKYALLAALLVVPAIGYARPADNKDFWRETQQRRMDDQNLVVNQEADRAPDSIEQDEYTGGYKRVEHDRKGN